MRFKRPKKRHRYTLLDDYNDREREKEKLFLSSKYIFFILTYNQIFIIQISEIILIEFNILFLIP